MTLPAWVAGLASALISLALGTGLSWVWLRQTELPWLAAQAQRLDRELRFVHAGLSGPTLAALQATVCLLLMAAGLLLAKAALAAAVLAAGLGPRLWLRQLRERRVARLEAQIDGWLVALANALRATPSLGEALASTVALTPAPLCEELDLILKEYRLGVALDQALAHGAERVGSRTLSAALLILRVARSAGGSLSACLEASAAALREMARLEGVVRTKTAEGKAQAVVISVLPLPLFALLDWVDHDFLAPLWRCDSGRVILASAALLWCAAMLLARQLARVDI